jgi:hypothetical protein
MDVVGQLQPVLFSAASEFTKKSANRQAHAIANHAGLQQSAFERND